MINDAFINSKLDKLIRQKLHDRVGQNLTQQLLDEIELAVYAATGYAVPFHVHVDENEEGHDEPFLVWEAPNGNLHHIRFRELT